MSLAVIVFFIGCAFIAVAIVGGGLEIRDLRIPQIKMPARILVGGFGAGLMLVAIGHPEWLKKLEQPGPPGPVVPAATPAAQSSDAPVTQIGFRPVRVSDWEPIDRINSFHLGQWAALICEYDFPPDPTDDPGFRPWRTEFLALKSAILLGEFKPSTANKDNVDRLSRINRAEIREYYRRKNRYPRALFRRITEPTSAIDWRLTLISQRLSATSGRRGSCFPALRPGPCRPGVHRS